MSSNTFNSLLTPCQLVEKYPQVKALGWNASKIGTFFSAGLLLGKRKMLKSMISEKSFLQLLDYVDHVSDKRHVREKRNYCEIANRLTPEELVSKYPQVEKEWEWNASKIGIFFSSGLLLGYRSGREYKALIDESSFQELIDYVTTVSMQSLF